LFLRIIISGLSKCFSNNGIIKLKVSGIRREGDVSKLLYNSTNVYGST
jgi:hypothetical protein